MQARPRLEQIGDLRAFAAIVDGGSLSAAARELDQSLAGISKRLQRLEQALGVRLMHRNTRQLSLTDEGREFLSHCRELLEQLRRTEELIGQRRGDVSGQIRITAGLAFARRQIAPLLGRLLARHPQLRIDLLATDEVVDTVRAGVDIAIRQAPLADSSLVARALVPDRRVLCAAPAYLAEHGTPQTPQDLLRHRCIVFGDAAPGWTFMRHGETQVVPVAGTVRVNTGDVAHAAALGGAGLVHKSIWEVADDLRRGQLVALLPDWSSPLQPIHALMPSARLQVPRVRRVLDFLQEELRSAAEVLPLDPLRPPPSLPWPGKLAAAELATA
ncbi:MAG: hypothetical protein RJA36_1203 [Pseudomonadota bacterium]|jgi:DNA-binding transcriptional LysR family regulator